MPEREIAQMSDSEHRHAVARLAGILAISADAIISVDDEQRITLFNDGAVRIFGYTSVEAVGQPLEMLMPDRFRGAHARHVRTFGAQRDGARRMGERQAISGRRKNGEEFPAEASISKLEIEGRPIYTVVLRDISERRRAEALIEQSRANLESRVAERTAELSAEIRRREATEAQLVRTQRMEAFGQLTGGVAHDFNNLLTVIAGNLELLEMRLGEGKEKDLLRRALDAAGMGARLTSRLLTFAQRRRYQTETVGLNEEIMSMIELLRRTIGEHIDLTTRLDPRLWAVRADRSEVENAVLNLAINARDAMPKGGRLMVETRNVVAEPDRIGTITKLPAGDYVCISVSDTGVGMPPGVLARAFEPFFTTKSPGKGTGLGLSSIYGFARESGGTSTIYSEVGRGTSVSIYLPRAESTAAAGVASLGAPIPLSAGETVLLVEDNAGVRDITRQHLEGLGYRVLEATDGPAAIRILDTDSPIDIVFSDVVMSGGMSGYDVARAVSERRHGTPILLTSGFATDAAASEDDALARLPILDKPYTRADLARALRKALDPDDPGA